MTINVSRKKSPYCSIFSACPLHASGQFFGEKYYNSKKLSGY
jgi:hypothetical protein